MKREVASLRLKTMAKTSAGYDSFFDGKKAAMWIEDLGVIVSGDEGDDLIPWSNIVSARLKEPWVRKPKY